MLINRYANFVRDIEPLGFDLAVMDGFLSKKTVQSVINIIESSQRRKKMVNGNYTIAAQHYSYSVLRNQLSAIMKSFFADGVKPLTVRTRPAKSKGHRHVNSNRVMYKHYNSKSCARVK
jgi:hypothetical protein